MLDTSVSVIIPHYDDLINLDRCLTALADQSFSHERYEIIVADNNSQAGFDAVKSIVAGRALLVVAPQKGAGLARNVGVSYSSNPTLAFIDSDCIAEPQWLAEGVKGLRHWDIVGGRVGVSVPEDRPITRVEAFEKVFAFDFQSYIEKKGFCGSGNLFCLRKTFDHVGPFLSEVSEDREWSFRATGLGYRLGYCAEAAILHPARESWYELKRKWVRINKESFELTRRHRWGVISWLLRTWMLPPSILVHTVRIMKTPVLSNANERIAAFETLVKIRLWRFVDAHKLLIKGIL